MTHDATDLAAVALDAVRAGAAAIRSVLAGGTIATEFKSGGHDLVTAADRASEAAVLAAIRRYRPDDEILAEESGQHPGTTDVRWLVDPLDGTANFVYGRPTYAVSVGAQRGAHHVAGAIVRPADGRWVAGADGRIRAGSNDQADATPPPTVTDRPLAESLVALGMPYQHTDRQRTLHAIADVVPMLRGIRIAGCAAGDLADVALGHCDGFVGIGLSDWDTAAGEAIVESNGGTVVRLRTSWQRTLLIAGTASLTTYLADQLGDLGTEPAAL